MIFWIMCNKVIIFIFIIIIFKLLIIKIDTSTEEPYEIQAQEQRINILKGMVNEGTIIYIF